MSIVTKDSNGNTFTLLSDYLRANGALEKFVMNVNKQSAKTYGRVGHNDPINSWFTWVSSPENHKYWENLHRARPKCLENDLMWLLVVTKEAALKDPRIAGKPTGILEEVYSQIPLRIKL